MPPAPTRTDRHAPAKARDRSIPLTEGEVVSAAIAIIAEVGVDGLTMRLLSDRLGVALGATYQHVRNKDLLLELVSNELFARIEAVDHVDEAWDLRMRSLFLSVYETFSAHPGLAEQIAEHETRSPQLRVLLEKILADAGFEPGTILDVLDALYFCTTGAVVAGGRSTYVSTARYVAAIDLLLHGATKRLDQDRAHA